MQEAMKERKADRRRGQAIFYDAINDRRRTANERRVGAVVSAEPGVVRPGVGEAAPVIERRRYLDCGME